MDDLRDFKALLERVAHISKWCPSTDQLRSIREDIKRTISSRGKLTVGDVEGIIARRVPDAIYAMLEGVDNSDLKALLLIAQQATASKQIDSH
ncbi:hypothetical protein [Pseudomonas mandelii]|jgi:hypothetical protein|uniref:Uncharacterized protein n=1 Tax=Pseudomonas mandelii TaxID=75612 RepID=A0A502ICW9_9PSED|nr:hypothetical protein [Pseudomonas mandelii]TPG84747.1 hypothetical protein EAH74_12025 [Pseudomonas mandelii]